MDKRVFLAVGRGLGKMGCRGMRGRWQDGHDAFPASCPYLVIKPEARESRDFNLAGKSKVPSSSFNHSLDSSKTLHVMLPHSCWSLLLMSRSLWGSLLYSCLLASDLRACSRHPQSNLGDKNILNNFLKVLKLCIIQRVS